jgi:hypothetical protein
LVGDDNCPDCDDDNMTDELDEYPKVIERNKKVYIYYTKDTDYIKANK